MLATIAKGVRAAGRAANHAVYRMAPFADETATFADVCGSRQVLFFSPHQDDEVITMGAGIAELSLGNPGNDNVVVLCSDGSKSAVRGRLGGEDTCDWHEGTHCHELDEAEFTAARDGEFRRSCEALGIKPGNVEIADPRAVDGDLDQAFADEVVARYVARHPDAVVCTIAPGPMSGKGDGQAQHPDHIRLGRAALKLFEQGTIKDLFFFVEPYCVEFMRRNAKENRLSRLEPSPAGAEMVETAVGAYRDWDPEQGSFGVGYHSVRGEIDRFLCDTTAYFYPQRRRA